PGALSESPPPERKPPTENAPKSAQPRAETTRPDPNVGGEAPPVAVNPKVPEGTAAPYKELLTLKGQAGPQPVAFSPDGKTLAHLSIEPGWHHTIKLVDVATHKESATLKGTPERILSLAYNPDSKTVASGNSEDSITLWDVATGKERATLKPEFPDLR